MSLMEKLGTEILACYKSFTQPLQTSGAALYSVAFCHMDGHVLHVHSPAWQPLLST